jgi:hypothetical protein
LRDRRAAPIRRVSRAPTPDDVLVAGSPAGDQHRCDTTPGRMLIKSWLQLWVRSTRFFRARWVRRSSPRSPQVNVYRIFEIGLRTATYATGTVAAASHMGGGSRSDSSSSRRVVST